MIKINTSGDYVQLIYVDPVQESVQQELKSDTDAFECSYDSEGKLYLQFGLMRFENPDPTDFTVNDVAVTDAADFISKLNALFTGGGGGGWGTSGTIATLTGDGVVAQAAHKITFNGTEDGPFVIAANGWWGLGVTDPAYLVQVNYDATDLLFVDAEGFQAGISATDVYDGGTSGSALALSAAGDDENVQFQLTTTDGTHISSIVGNGLLGTIAYTADTHTFNGVINLPTQAAPSAPNDGDIWREDNTNTGLKIRINGVTKTIVVA